MLAIRLTFIHRVSHPILQCPNQRDINRACIADIPAPAWHDNSWGISIAVDDDGVTLHGFMTELENNCSLSEYGQASRILHVTSAGSPAGPWTVQGIALREFAHNPNIVRDVDGAWLLFHIGTDFGPYCETDCSSGKPVRNASCHASASHASSVARAVSPDGPWERVSNIFPDSSLLGGGGGAAKNGSPAPFTRNPAADETNPSAYVFKNGTIFATARRWTNGIPVYTAQVGGSLLAVCPPLQLLASPATSAPPPPAVLARAVHAARAAPALHRARDCRPRRWSRGGAVPVAGTRPPYRLRRGPLPLARRRQRRLPHAHAPPAGRHELQVGRGEGRGARSHPVAPLPPPLRRCSATGPTPDDCRCGGGHLYAETAWGPWWYDPVMVYNCTLRVRRGAWLIRIGCGGRWPRSE